MDNIEFSTSSEILVNLYLIQIWNHTKDTTRIYLICTFSIYTVTLRM